MISNNLGLSAYMFFNDTIAAIATAPGEASISIVKISGPEAISISNKVFSKDLSSFSSHTVHLGHAYDLKGQLIDECLVVLMKAPRSFTGENIVEFQCHGGYFASTKILATLFDAGARPALPGEFTQRAFLNGKIDLIQAEAIQNIVSADNAEAFEIAQKHLKGAFSAKISTISTLIVKTLAYIEVQADFPEEGEDFSLSDQSDLWLQEAISLTEDLLSTFDEGQRLTQGSSIVLAGRPNAGKSSLMNALLEEDRAIVTDIPGTTRDIIKESWTIGGKSVRLLDTAGIRETLDPIEKAGIEKGFQAMEHAQLILWVADPSSSEDLPDILLRKPSFVLWSKADLNHPIPRISVDLPQISFSATTRQGLQEIRQAVGHWVQNNTTNPSSKVFLVSSRHHNILKKVASKLAAARQLKINREEPEFISLELREALHETGLISGSNASEEILSEIFSRFCIGK